MNLIRLDHYWAKRRARVNAAMHLGFHKMWIIFSVAEELFVTFSRKASSW